MNPNTFCETVPINSIRNNGLSFCDLTLVCNGACVACYAEALLGKYNECNLYCIACKMSQVVEFFSVGNRTD